MPDTDHGLIGELAKPAKYRRITGDKDPYDPMDKPLPYNYDIDYDEWSPEEVKMAEAEHLERQTLWHVLKGTLAGVCEQI